MIVSFLLILLVLVKLLGLGLVRFIVVVLLLGVVGVECIFWWIFGIIDYEMNWC